MKKLFLCFLMASSVLTSCSDDDSDNSNGGGDNNGIEFSDKPVSGKLYDKNFTINGSRGQFVNMFDVESVQIQISSENIGCETGQFSGEFPIQITAPRAVGVYTTNAYVNFNDPDSDDFVSMSGGSTVEITSLTDTMVKGRVISTFDEKTYINGTFEVPICE